MPRSLLLLALLGACTAPVDDPATDPEVASSNTPPDCGEPPRADTDEDPRLLRWPVYTDVTTERATVQWGLPVGSVGTLQWGEGDAFDQEVTAEAATVDALVDPLARQVAVMEGLRPDTWYCLRLQLDGDDVTGPLTLRTPPRPDTARTVRFLVMGDYGNGSEAAARVRDAILKHEGAFDFWLTTGDNAYSDGTWDEWQDNVFAFYRHLLKRVPYYPIPGNHDYRDGSLQPMLDSLELPANAYRDEDQERYYSFDWGPLHVTAADSQSAVYQLTAAPDDDMLDWFEDDLAAAADRPWRVAAWHHPRYMTQPDRGPEPGSLLQLAPAAEAGQTDLVLNGHNHAYERFGHIRGGEKLTEGGTTYVISGAGGASLYGVTPDGGDHPALSLRDHGTATHHFMLFEADACTLTGRAIDLDGVEFDRFTLKRC